MSTFRDAIMDAAAAEGYDNPKWSFGSVTDAILATPEMEAIRSFCEWFAHRHGSIEDMRRVLADEAHLPESVIDWVLEA